MVSLCFYCLLLIYGCVGRKPQKVTRFGADPTVKATWRFIRSWICHNHKAYYSYVLLCAFSMYQFWWHVCIGYYKRRNHERSLPFAIQREIEWEKIKPADDDDDEYDEEDYGDEEGEEAPAAEAGEEEEEE